MIRLRLIFTFFVCIIYTTAQAQENIKFSGNVIQLNQTLVEGDAYLLSVKDSSVVKFTTVIDGKFSFKDVVLGKYYLQIIVPGAQHYLQPVDLSVEKSLAIELTPLAKSLEDVTIVATKKVFSNKNGNIKINVEGSPLATLSNPVDLLSKLPQLQIDPTGEAVTVVGKGSPLIYINNQQVTMAQLTALAVSDIKSIEILKNPSSKYEANGRTVILVTRKTNRQDNIKTDISETLAFRKYFTNNLGINTGYKKRKLELKSNLQYNQIKNWERNAYDFSIPARQVQFNYDATAVTTRPQFLIGQDVYYQLDSSNYISLNGSLRSQNEQYPILTNSFSQNGIEENDIYTDNSNEQKRVFTTSILNYNKDLKKFSAQVFAGAQFSTYRRTNYSNIHNTYNNEPALLNQERFQHNDINALSAKMDISKDLKHAGKAEAGFNVASTNSNSITNIKNYNPSGLDTINYKYKETNTAAYTQYTGKIKKAEYFAGLRMEKTNLISGPPAGPVLVRRNYLQFFPKINLNFTIDSLQSFSFSYAKSIARPDFSKVTNQSTYINPFFEWANNINLKPTTTHEISGTYQYNNYSVAFTFYQANGPVYPDFVYNPVRYTLRRTDINYPGETGATATFTIPVNVKKIKSANVIMGTLSKIKNAQAAANRPTPYLYLYSDNQISLSKGYLFSLSGWLYTGANDGIFERSAIFTVDSSITKKLFNKLTCTIRANNVLDSRNSTEIFNINDIASSGTYYNTRDFSLSFKYSIGKNLESKFHKKEVDENVNRIN